VSKTTLAYIFLLFLLGFFFHLKGKKTSSYGDFFSVLPHQALQKQSFKIDMVFFIASNFGFHGYVNVLIQGIFYIELLPEVLNNLNFYSSSFSLHIQTWLYHQHYWQYTLFIFAFLIYDFSAYLAHLTLHKSKYLWEFHKVHHYGEQLTYLSGARIHPIDAFITSYIPKFTVALFLSTIQPINSTIFDAPYAIFPRESFILFALVIALPELLNKFNHTHYPIRFGKYLDGLIVSPAFHTIHHSKKIIGNNFGATFAIWDVIFKTARLPGDVIDLKNHPIGVEELGDEYFGSFFEALFKPFKNIFSLAKEDLAKLIGF
jgi:sterol desaturase/sphingolipid hydroxylase (fatty acid hydroxylase superfamily)